MPDEILFRMVRVTSPGNGGVEPGAIGAGDIAFYTVPPLRQAVVFITGYNPTAGPITYYAEIGTLGVYSRTAAPVTVAPGLNTNLSGCFPVLSGGQVAAVNASAPGLVLAPRVLEFDRHRFVRQGLVTTWAASADNLLYTVPGDRSAFLFDSVPVAGAVGAQVCYCQWTGANRLVQLKLNGIAIGPGVTVATGAKVNLAAPAALSGGDRLALASDSGDSRQTAWVSAIEALG